MGVAGLWDILRPAGQTRSLSHLALQEGFNRPPATGPHHRGFRIGIDASIWFFHAAYGREGENPELRLLFFRCAKLMNTPFLPLFVFDGPLRPNVKRGKRIAKEAHWLTQGMKKIIEVFGYEWRTAPGEAEAELAYLNSIGVIDGVLSDDVDNFLFGATLVIRNPSATLTGNAAAGVLPTTNHTTIFSSHRIETHEDIGLTKGGLVLIGMLAGGDYNKGLEGCGMKVAVGLAKCGFGDSLVEACERMITVQEDGGEDEDGKEELERWLVGWRADVARELASNSMGHLPSKRVALSKALLTSNNVPTPPPSVPSSQSSKPKSKSKSKSATAAGSDTFPDLTVLLYYTRPLTSETHRKSARNKLPLAFAREPDLAGIAGICELYFEWGWREMIIKRFKTLLWDGAVCRILRRAVVEADRKVFGDLPAAPNTPRKHRNRDEDACGTPSKMIASHFSSQPSQRRVDSPSSSPISFSPSKKARNADRVEKEALITKIHATRTHKITDGLLEYRLEVAPAQLVRLVNAGIQGTRQAPEVDDVYAAAAEEEEDEDSDSDLSEGEGNKKGKGAKKKKGTTEFADPEEHVRMWMPACMVRLVEPELVAEYEEGLRRKEEKKAGRGKGHKKAAFLETEGESDGVDVRKAKAKKTAGKTKAAVILLDKSEAENCSPPKKAAGKKAAGKLKAKPSLLDLLDESEADNSGSRKKAPRKVKSKLPVKAKASTTYVHVSDSDSMGSDKVKKNLKGYFGVVMPTLSSKDKTDAPARAPVASGSTARAPTASVPNASSYKARSKPPAISRRPRYASDSDSEPNVASKGSNDKVISSIRPISAALSPVAVRRTSPENMRRPFPMDFDMDGSAEPAWNSGAGHEDPFLDREIRAGSSGSQQVRTRPTSSTAPESDMAYPKKSPRKSKKQTPPKQSTISTRPTSPSPARARAKPARLATLPPRKTKPVSDLGIIDISSGDEAPAIYRKPMKAPLLLAREKKVTQKTLGTVFKAQKLGVPRAKVGSSPITARPGATSDDDIIDLT